MRTSWDHSDIGRMPERDAGSYTGTIADINTHAGSNLHTLSHLHALSDLYPCPHLYPVPHVDASTDGNIHA